jgi:transposase
LRYADRRDWLPRIAQRASKFRKNFHDSSPPTKGDAFAHRNHNGMRDSRDGRRVAIAQQIHKEVLSVDSRFVGLNATSETIEVAIRPTGELWKTDFAEESITATASKLKGMQPTLVVMEGTGTFELPVAGTFATIGVPFTIVNPRSLREFAKAVGRISRLDFSQAGLLAYFGELVHPDPRPLPDDLIRKLIDFRSRRDDLTQMLILERTRLAEAPEILRKDMLRHITFLEQSISTMNQEFNRSVRYSTAWH